MAVLDQPRNFLSELPVSRPLCAMHSLLEELFIFN